MWPLNDFASEETDYEEWNNLDNLENAIKECKEKLQKAKEDNNEKQSTLRDLLVHYESLQRNMDKARENLKIWLIKPEEKNFWLFSWKICQLLYLYMIFKLK